MEVSNAEDVQQDIKLIKAIDSQYLMAISGQKPSTLTQMKDVVEGQKHFLDLALHKRKKTLPYFNDQSHVQVVGTVHFADNPTCIKFVHVLVKIIKDNFQISNSLQAVKVWFYYLSADEIFRRSLKPTLKMFQILNLGQFLS